MGDRRITGRGALTNPGQRKDAFIRVMLAVHAGMPYESAACAFEDVQAQKERVQREDAMAFNTVLWGRSCDGCL